MRFRAETFIDSAVKSKVEEQQLTDPNVPVRAGGEMGIFLPFASRGTDMEGIARAMAEGGSFYPSIHLTWHFEEAHFEVARPVYMQAAMTTDWAKGVWSATWESSGGPSWFSGGKSPFVTWAQDKTPGFTCHEGTQTILMLSWLAAGYRGFGLWTWNQRTAGWEAGEFGLLDRNRKVTERARRAGAIGLAARKFRRELWESDKQPMVGVMQDFDNEAMWAAMGVMGRDIYKSQPIRARMGASRALINGNVPWEHVTPRQMADGLGGRYGTIYLPAFISLSDELLDMLITYVEEGGRVVLDMPSAYLDAFGRVLYTDVGTKFEKLFGSILNEYGYARGINNAWTIGDIPLEGFTAVMTPTTAKVVASYTDQGGAAITENSLGKGTAVILGAEASLDCHKPGNEKMERLIRDICLNGKALPYACEGALAYRLVAPKSTHYFLINDGPAKEVILRLNEGKGTCTDAITGEVIDLDRPVSVEREGGRWLRVETA
jgi:beta-galactosidase